MIILLQNFALQTTTMPHYEILNSKYSFQLLQ